MDDQMKLKAAKEVYETLCNTLDARDWKYTRHDDDLTVTVGVNGDDIPMQLIIQSNPKKQLLTLMSFLPFTMDEDNRVLGAVATCHANYLLADGSFDYNLEEGKISFRMNIAFMDSLIGADAIDYLIGFSLAAIDKYNDQFMMLNKGKMSLADFIKDN